MGKPFVLSNTRGFQKAGEVWGGRGNLQRLRAREAVAHTSSTESSPHHKVDGVISFLSMKNLRLRDSHLPEGTQLSPGKAKMQAPVFSCPRYPPGELCAFGSGVPSLITVKGRRDQAPTVCPHRSLPMATECPLPVLPTLHCPQTRLSSQAAPLILPQM